MKLDGKTIRILRFSGLALGLIFCACIIWFLIGGSIPIFPVHGRILDGLAAQSKFRSPDGFFLTNEIIPVGTSLDAVMKDLKQEGFTCQKNPNEPNKYGAFFCRKPTLYHPLCARGWFVDLYIDSTSKTVLRSTARTDDNCT
jgi:hypothetical protein